MSKNSEKRAPESEAKPKPESIKLVETPAGEEVALGMRAQLKEGMSAALEGKGMRAPQSSMQAKQPEDPPPKPPDAGQSATPKKS